MRSSIACNDRLELNAVRALNKTLYLKFRNSNWLDAISKMEHNKFRKLFVIQPCDVTFINICTN